MDASLYYLREGADGERQVTFDELKTRAEAGTLSPEALVRPAEAESWVPAGSLAGLFPATLPAHAPSPATSEVAHADEQPEDEELTAREAARFLELLRPRHYLINGMLALTIAIFGWLVADLGWTSVGKIPLAKALEFGASWTPHTVGQGEYWRIFTSAALNISWFGLAMALLLLHWVGRGVEAELGSVRMAVLALPCQIGGAMAGMYLYPSQVVSGFDYLFPGLLGALISHRLLVGTATLKQCAKTLGFYCCWIFGCFWFLGGFGIWASIAALCLGILAGAALATGPWWRRTAFYALLMATIISSSMYAAQEIARSPLVARYDLRVAFKRHLRDIRRIMEAQEALDSTLLSAVQARARDKAETGPPERWLAMAQGYHDELAALRPAHPELQPLHELLLKHVCLLKTEAGKAVEFLNQPGSTTLTAYKESDQARDAAFKDFIAARDALFAKHGLRPAGAPAPGNVPPPPKKAPVKNGPAPPAKSSGGG